MSLISSVERQITFLSLQSIQKDKPEWILAGTFLLVLLVILLIRIVCRKRKMRAEEADRAGAERVTRDTAEMPALQDLYLEQYGFRVLEDITYIHTEERITLEEDGGTVWNG